MHNNIELGQRWTKYGRWNSIKKSIYTVVHKYTWSTLLRYRYSQASRRRLDDLDGRTMGYCTASCNYILADLWRRLWTIIGVLVWKWVEKSQRKISPAFASHLAQSRAWDAMMMMGIGVVGFKIRSYYIPSVKNKECRDRVERCHHLINLGAKVDPWSQGGLSHNVTYRIFGY